MHTEITLLCSGNEVLEFTVRSYEKREEYLYREIR